MGEQQCCLLTSAIPQHLLLRALRRLQVEGTNRESGQSGHQVTFSLVSSRILTGG
jgi:hypothetical protein